MTPDPLGWFIAGLAAMAFLILWFFVGYRALLEKKAGLDAARDHILLHKKLLMQERGSPHDTTAQHILDTRCLVYAAVAKEYNTLLAKPLYCIPGYLLGFRPAPKDGESL